MTWLQARCDARPLYGLFAPGESAASDLVQQAVGSLARHCEQVFVIGHDPLPGTELLSDRVSGMGESSPLISALLQHPEAAWLAVIGVPEAEATEDLAALVQKRNPFKQATLLPPTADVSASLGLFEPKSIHRLLHNLGMGCTSIHEAVCD